MIYPWSPKIDDLQGKYVGLGHTDSPSIVNGSNGQEQISCCTLSTNTELALLWDSLSGNCKLLQVGFQKSAHLKHRWGAGLRVEIQVASINKDFDLKSAKTIFKRGSWTRLQHDSENARTFLKWVLLGTLAQGSILFRTLCSILFEENFSTTLSNGLRVWLIRSI